MTRFFKKNPDFDATDSSLEDSSPQNDDEFLIEEGWHRRSLRDPEIFGYFFDKYYDRIFGFLYNMTRSRDMADELTQATFVTAFEKRSGFVFREVPIGAWLFQIARSKAIKTDLQRERQVPLEFLKAGDGTLVEFRPGPDHRLLSKEEQSRLFQGLDLLDPDCRSWLVLHYFEGLTTPQLARIAGVKEGTMKSRLSRCLERLRDHLKGLQ